MTTTKFDIVRDLLKYNAIEIRSDDNPFVYSSGNRGPGYIMVKGLVSHPALVKKWCQCLAQKMFDDGYCPDIVDGNVTGGMIYGWELCRALSKLYKREIPFVYLRGARKSGGHFELITGPQQSRKIKLGMDVLVCEELVNYGQSTINAANAFRDCGYKVSHCACILDYGHHETLKNLSDNNLKLFSLINLQEALHIMRKYKLVETRLVDNYEEFLSDPIVYQLKRKWTIPKISAENAIKRGWKLTKLSSIKALEFGSPKEKIRDGMVYYGLQRKKRKRTDMEGVAKRRKIENKKSKEIGVFLSSKDLSSTYFEMSQSTVFIALDMPQSKALDFVNDIFKSLGTSVNNLNFGFKVNLDNILGCEKNDLSGYEFIRKVKKFGKPIFVDLKMWNGERTMVKIVKDLVRLDVDYVNVYAHAGVKFLKSVVDVVKATKTKILALTVLTHYDDEYCQDVYGCGFTEELKRLEAIVLKAGVHGVVCSPRHVDLINNKLIKVCPGIRPTWFNNQRTNNQTQITTPIQAVEAGANALVIGSPITKSNNPIQALKLILNELSTNAPTE